MEISSLSCVFMGCISSPAVLVWEWETNKSLNVNTQRQCVSYERRVTYQVDTLYFLAEPDM